MLQIWFQPANAASSQARLTLLKQICVEIELYLKARRARDVSQEVTRLSSYSKLLEELTGDINLESVGWNLVNHAREAVACDRVCLFIACNYDRTLNSDAVMSGFEYEFILQACSGLKKPHPKSEQAVVLQRVAQTLTQMSLGKTAGEPEPVPGGESPALLTEDSIKRPTAEPKPAPAPAARRLGTPITLMVRDPAKTATRPAEVNDYFHLMPMNWATVIPLFDRNQRVCGILLFEGIKLEEKLGNSLKPMSEMAVSAGRALGSARYCNQHRSMRVARRLISYRQTYVNTPAKRKWLHFGLPLIVLAGAMIFPVTYRIKGNASISRLNASKAAAVAEKLRADEARAIVRAPFDGLVLGAQSLSTRIGDIPRIGEPILQVIDPGAWQVKASLRERDLVFLDRRLRENGPVPATLRLASNPAHTYQLELKSADQLAYGLDTSLGEYQFTAMVPLAAVLDDANFLKSGFTGRISFDAGSKSLAYVLFKDFIDFLTVRFF